jgi:hypothetical protein
VTRALAAAVVLLAAVISLSAQAPVVNAVVEKRTPSGDFTRDVQSVASRPTASWIGYRVPIQRRRDVSIQSFDNCCGRCRLAPPTELVVLARVQQGAIAELRSLGVDCDMDAGGMPLVWFDGVTADASVAWLNTLVTQAEANRRISESALSAIAQHAGSAASKALVQFAQTGTTQMRGRALSWLAQRATNEALPVIDAALKDPELEVKKQAVNALSRFPNQEGVPKLIEVARSHSNAEVRRQAMLRLGDSKDPRAVDFFAQILLK